MLRQHVRYGWKQHDLVEEFVAVILSGSLETFTASHPRNGGGAWSTSVAGVTMPT
jgi:hypothetical protein